MRGSARRAPARRPQRPRAHTLLSSRAQVPTGVTLEYGSDDFVSHEDAGIRAFRDCAVVLVAGGLGERLGYSVRRRAASPCAACGPRPSLFLSLSASALPLHRRRCRLPRARLAGN